MSEFSPMLAKPADLKRVRYPVVGSPKLDGIRAIVLGGKVMSRNMIEIPNRKVQADFSMLENCDGELIVGDPTAEDVFRKTSSATLTSDSLEQITFYVFDLVGPEGYSNRLVKLADLVVNAPNVVFVPVEVLNNEEELMVYEERMCDLGYEGIMIRKPHGAYKQGRSTVNEGGLLKIKRFHDSEALILELLEGEINTNPSRVDGTGHSKRSSHAAGKIPSGTLGAFRLRDIHTGVEFECGTGKGLTHKARDEMWAHKVEVEAAGLVCRYKFQLVGVKDKPRFPTYGGLRPIFDVPKKEAA